MKDENSKQNSNCKFHWKIHLDTQTNLADYLGLVGLG